MIKRISGISFDKLVIVGEQICYSLSTFAFTITCARAMNVDDFGYFSLFFTGVVLLVGLQRTFLSEPLMILSGEVDSKHSQQAYQSSFAMLSLAFGIVAAAIIAVIAFMLSIAGNAIYLAIFIIFPFIQDFARYIYLLRRQYIALVATTLCVAIVQLALVVVALTTVVVTPTMALCIWGLGSAIGVLAFTVQARAWFVIRKQGTDFIRPSLKLGSQFAAEYFIGIMTVQGVLIASTFVSGPAASAALRGANALIGPVRMILQAMPSVILTKSATLSNDRPLLIKTVITMTALFSVFFLLWLLVLLNLPASVGAKLLGESWTVVKPVLPLVGLALIPNAVVNFTAMGLKVLKRGDLLAKSRLKLVPFSLLLSIGGALYAGAYGGAAGSLTASVIAAFIWSTNFFKVTREKHESLNIRSS